MWPLFGISNQMLAAIALIFATVILFKMKQERYSWVTLLPTAWLLLCTLTASWQKIFSPDVHIGFLAHAAKFQAAMQAGTLLAPAHSMAQMFQIITNDWVDATLAFFFSVVLIVLFLFGAVASRRAFKNAAPTFKVESLPLNTVVNSYHRCC